MKKTRNKILFWTPRILSILFIGFFALFSLDIFGNGYGFWETVVGLFMHNLPSLILLAVLIVAWKHELVGAIAFFAGGLLYITLLLRTMLMNPPPQWYMLSWSVTIAGPAFVIGILWILDWRQKRKR